MLLSRLKDTEEKVDCRGWEEDRLSWEKVTHRSIPEEMCAGHLGGAGQEPKLGRRVQACPGETAGLVPDHRKQVNGTVK